ncbi:MAG: hypothetical protein IKB28_01955 [Clostridia bacterium]|nr:hypothetical protein [Clostridia bacterium]
MKQEKIAMSMSYIDDDLIIEAAKVRKPATRSVKWQTVAIRLGGLAACLVLAVGLTFGALTGSVSMDGTKLGTQPTPVVTARSAQPFSQASESPWENIPELSLDFSRSTSLSFTEGTIAIVNSDGSTEPIEQNQKLRGQVTIFVMPETAADTYTITTNRGFDIVLSLIEGEWYVHIEK